MRVRLVVPVVSDLGGTERYTLGLARSLAARGHDVEVRCARDAGGLAGVPGVTVRRLPGVDLGGRRGMLAFAAASAAMARGSVDVVLGQGRVFGHDVYRAGGGSHAAWLEARENADGRAPSAWDRAERALDRRVLRSARVVICNSQMARDDLLRDGVPAERLCVVRNGVDLARFGPDPERRAHARRDVPDGGRVAVFLGSGFARKGLSTAIAAFLGVASPLDRLWVIGADRHAARWRVGPGEDPRISWLGSVAAPEELLPGADALLLPTWYDPAANATLEALACGVPVVTSARDGAAEIVPDGPAGAPGDTPAFMRRLAAAWSAGGPGRVRARAAAEAWPAPRNTDAVSAILERVAGEVAG